MGDVGKPLGVILAGGAGRRIGGGKPLVMLAGRPLIAHVIARLDPQCAALAINTNDPAGLAALGVPVIADGVDGGQGPLSGILAAMDWAASQGAPRVLTAPVDTPFLPRDLAARLAEAQAPIALAATDDGVQGTCGLWDMGLRMALAQALADGRRKVSEFAMAQGAVTVRFDAADAFLNINTPDDLAAAKAMLGPR